MPYSVEEIKRKYRDKFESEVIYVDATPLLEYMEYLEAISSFQDCPTTRECLRKLEIEHRATLEYVSDLEERLSLNWKNQ